MKTLSLRSSPQEIALVADKLKPIDPQLIIIVGSLQEMREAEGNLKLFAAQLCNAQIIGCSTSGEIDEKGVSDKGLVITATHFDHAHIRCASQELLPHVPLPEAGENIVKSLLDENLKGIFILVPGVGYNGSELVRGFRKALPAHIALSGGLAGDGLRFAETCTLLKDKLYRSHIVAVGLYGDDLVIGTGSRGGWKPFGPARRVTKATGNVLYELDGKPALDLYKSYLGERAVGLPATGMPYPLALLGNDHNATGLIRSVVDVDHKMNALILGGDISLNSLVCLMHANTEFLAEGAANAARDACGSDRNAEQNSLCILVSCIGRRSVMGEDTDEEIEAVRDVLGKNSTICGFYSYGEICPFDPTHKIELHNHTMTVTYIYER